MRQLDEEQQGRLVKAVTEDESENAVSKEQKSAASVR